MTRPLSWLYHVVASYCWRWQYKIGEQILLWSAYKQILWGKSSSLASVTSYAVSFWNLRFMESMLATFLFSSGLGMSLPLPVKNLVTDNGRMWYVYSKQRLLTQRIRRFLQVWPGHFPDFRVGPVNEASFVVLTAMWKGVAGVSGV